MRFIAILLTGILLFSGIHTYAHKNKKITISFLPVIDTIPLAPKENNILYNSADTLVIEAFRFYVSGITLYTNDKSVWKETSGYHLIDAASPSTLSLELNIPENINANEIRFHLGIDSITNVSGVMGGDLDPSKGMYWTWQSGYINFKLEGTNKRCPNRKNEFQFHLGGYASSFASIQTVALNIKPTNHIDIITNIAPFLYNIDITTQNSIMIPGAQAVKLSQLAKGMFSIRQ